METGTQSSAVSYPYQMDALWSCSSLAGKYKSKQNRCCSFRVWLENLRQCRVSAGELYTFTALDIVDSPCKHKRSERCVWVEVLLGVVGICPKFTLGRGEIRRRGTQSRQRMKCRKPWKHSEWSGGGGGGETKITTINQEETLEHETVFTFQNDSKFQILKHSKKIFHFFLCHFRPQNVFCFNS